MKYKISKPLLVPSLFLLMFFFLITNAATEEIYEFERMWPIQTSQHYFDSPYDIVADSEGFIYVADMWNCCIQKLTSDGHFVTKWGGYGDIEGKFSYPAGIAVDNRGFVYVVDTDNYRIQKFTSNGEFVTKWGSHGSGNGEFIFGEMYGDFSDFTIFSGIAVDKNGFVYVSDTFNDRIQKFTSDGQFVTKWGTYGNKDGEFNWPSDIAVNSNGFVYVVDTYNSRIQKFTENGNFVTEWGKEGSGKGQFSFSDDYTFWGLGWYYFSGIAVDHNDFIYVMDTFNSRIQQFDTEGNFLTEWEAHWYNGITTDNKGFFYIADGLDGVVKFAENGLRIAEWEASGSTDGEFDNPRGIAIDNNGFVYIADKYNHRIQKFAWNGQFIAKWGSKGSDDGQFNQPNGIEVDDKGFVYVSDYNHRIQKFTTDGKFIGKWGSKGSDGGLFDHPEDIAVDKNGSIYVADRLNHRIQKFTSDGQFIAKWGNEGYNDGEFHNPYGIAIDSNDFIYITEYVVTNNPSINNIQKYTGDGQFLEKWQSDSSLGIDIDSNNFIYVADQDNRIRKLNSYGDVISEFGEYGSGTGMLNGPFGVCVGINDMVYVVEEDNDRVQVFRKTEAGGLTKAIIVAGRSSEDDSLWDDTQVCANFAYQSMTYQGLTKDTIHYLSSDTNLDLDGNGIWNEIDGIPSIDNLKYAVTQWTSEEPRADSVVLYLTDHGKKDRFRMSDNEILTASDLDLWLDQLQENLPGRVIVVYDACKSGSFMSLDPPDGRERIVITSASAEESAHFVNQGTISFSNFFWTRILNGRDVRDAFELASNAMQNFQTPLLDANGNGVGNESMDFGLVQDISIGNGTDIGGDMPIIGSVSPDQIIQDGNSTDLFAYATDDRVVERVWAVISPPGYGLVLTDKPVKELPSVDLVPAGNHRYEGTYGGFNIKGTYHISIFAMDKDGNKSKPVLTTVSVENPIKRRFIIVAGGEPSDSLWPTIEKGIQSAFNALKVQKYSTDDIYLMSSATIPGVEMIPVKSSLNNLKQAFESCASENTQDLVLYLVGRGVDQAFGVNTEEYLTATRLNKWLDSLQEKISGKVVVIIDSCWSGSFIPVIASMKNRIVISSTSGFQPASDGDISFSNIFWLEVLNGINVYYAFSKAMKALNFAGNGQTPCLDSDGNGQCDKWADAQSARDYEIGMGLVLASDEPVIKDVSPVQILNNETSASVWAENVISTGTIKRVWAVIVPPDKKIEQPFDPFEACELNLLTVDLTDDAGNGRYEGVYNGFTESGTYEVAVFAMDENGNISDPEPAKVIKAGPDTYEPDNEYSQASVIFIGVIQEHNFYESGDADLVKFYGLSNIEYEIEAINVGDDCDIIIKVYNENFTVPLQINNTNGSGANEFLNWLCPADGIYFAKVTNNIADASGENTNYELSVNYASVSSEERIIQGYVADSVTGYPVDSAKIKTDNSATAISRPDGYYRITAHEYGNLKLISEADKYETFNTEILIEPSQIIYLPISMVLLTTKGDIDGNGLVDLRDALLALKTTSGIDNVPLDYLYKQSSVNEDRRISLEDTIYILQLMAEIK